MLLTTFGAIMGFAAELFRMGEELLHSAERGAVDPALRALLEELTSDQKKNCALMETARREHVTEMILEPIAGPRREDYEMSLALPQMSGDEDVLRLAMAVEERERKFFEECSTKLPFPEVARIFRKVMQKREQNLSMLRRITRT